jgi:mannose-6-phosphate isomerase-like protein (cupin superfamily)
MNENIPYKENIENITEKNRAFRKILYTNEFQQLVVMSLEPREEIGMESHVGSQFIRIESGRGVAYIGGKMRRLKPGDAIIIDPGVQHNVINTSIKKRMKLYAIYSPPEHVSS